MLQLHVADRLTEARRREVFRLLVVGQDCGMSVVEAREMARSRFGLDDEQLRRIEQEGLDGNWPPLG
jgi:hypothetical protein